MGGRWAASSLFVVPTVAMCLFLAIPKMWAMLTSRRRYSFSVIAAHHLYLVSIVLSTSMPIVDNRLHLSILAVEYRRYSDATVYSDYTPKSKALQSKLVQLGNLSFCLLKRTSKYFQARPLATGLNPPSSKSPSCFDPLLYPSPALHVTAMNYQFWFPCFLLSHV